MAEQFGRQEIAAGGRDVALFEEMPSATAASTRQEVNASEFADMVIHRLPRELHVACDARGGIRLQQSGKNL
jgi:hypothetical protein